MMERLYGVFVRLLKWAYPTEAHRAWGEAFHEDAAALLRRYRIRHGQVLGWILAVWAMVVDTFWGARMAWSDRDRGRSSRGRFEHGRRGRLFERFGGWGDDVRVAVRGLTRRPALAGVVAVTLGVGLSANVTIFGILDRVVLSPMRFEGGERVVFLALRDESRGWQFAPSQQHLDLWRGESRTLEAVEVYRPGSFRIARGTDAPESVQGASVSVGMLSMTSEQPVLGRGFNADDARAGAPRVVMLDESWWRSEYGADPDVVGKTVRIEGEVAVIVGVWPGHVRPSLQQDPAIWTPLPRGRELERTIWSTVVAMHAPDADEAALNAELGRLGTPVDADAPEGTPVAESATAFLSATFLESIWLLFWGTLVLGVVAAVNAANLLLGRADGRGGELGIRAALGGSRLRLFRLFATEALILSLAGVFVGVVLSVLAVTALVAWMPSDVGVVDDRVLLTGRVAVWGLLMTAALVTVCTLVPASRFRRGGLRELIRGGDGARGSLATSSRLRSGLVVAQVALAVLLVTGSTLTLRSWRALSRVDPGWQVSETVLVGLRLPDDRYPDAGLRAAFWDRLIERLSALPDVDGVTSMGNPFFRSSISRRVPVPETWVGPPLDDDVFATTDFGLENHFEVLGVPIRGEVRAGRGGERTVAVNEAYVRLFGSVLGDRIGFPDDSIRWTVTAVTGDVRAAGLRNAGDQVHLFYPEERLDNAFHRVVLRTNRPSVVAGLVRSAIAELDAELRAGELATGREALAGQATRERFAALLLTVLGITTLFLAAAGVYGVVALAVRRRTREVGLRMALGAVGAHIVRDVVLRGMRPVLGGAVVGLALSSLAASRVEQLLFEITERDPVSLTAGVAVLLLVGLVAAWIPARTATRIDPLEALRAE